jgi:biotin transporter BioY
MSRPTRRRRALQAEAGKPTRTLVAVRALYVLGGLALALFFGAAVFWTSVYFASDGEVAFAVEPLPFVVWGGLALVAVAIWLRRRRRVAR